MSYRKTLVSDTNIWIAFNDAKLLKAVFALPYDWVTTDFVVHELIRPPASSLLKLGLHQVELNGEQIERGQELHSSNPSTSSIDISTLVYAMENKLTLVTGDGQLRSLALKLKIKVHGVLWVLDEIVGLGIAPKRTVANGLVAMIKANNWLPEDECRVRLLEWSK
jgi:predicted nucleic acid-binding protein